MPYVADDDFLSEKQLLDKSYYSKYSRDLLSARDWGYRKTPLYINFIILGPHEKDLTIDIVVRENEKSPDTIISSKSLVKAELVRGKSFSMLIPPIDKKYRYLAVHYKVEGIAATADPSTGQTCPVDPFLDNPADLKNGITAYLSHNFVCTVEYPRANTEKVYTS